MSNWISKHLATCFIAVIGLIMILGIIDSKGISNVKATANSKVDTIQFKIVVLSKYDSMMIMLHEINQKIKK